MISLIEAKLIGEEARKLLAEVVLNPINLKLETIMATFTEIRDKLQQSNATIEEIRGDVQELKAQTDTLNAKVTELQAKIPNDALVQEIADLVGEQQATLRSIADVVPEPEPTPEPTPEPPPAEPTEPTA
jgi:peptidoglycan hydrolase CwlO-like protein